MKPTIYILDDDPSVVKILANIINSTSKGIVVGKNTNPNTAVLEIMSLKPDIVLIDMLMPNLDGIGVITSLKEFNLKCVFIMISEVQSKDIISKAYNSGIEFFINKPINMIEVAHVIQKVADTILLKDLTKILHDKVEPAQLEANHDETNTKIMKVLSDIGIVGRKGVKELLLLIKYILEDKNKFGINYEFRLKDYYQGINEELHDSSLTDKAIEQRIRRLLQYGLVNLANIGLEDFGSIIFETYSSTLYEFKEVRQEMNYVKGKSFYHGKSNIKRFVEGLLYFVK